MTKSLFTRFDVDELQIRRAANEMALALARALKQHRHNLADKAVIERLLLVFKQVLQFQQARRS